MFGVLVFFGISTLALGILQITRTINFPGGYEQPLEGINTAGGETTVEQLRSKDTDGDGLSDFDELYVYKTSMYLADSDSDGYSDKEEIDNGFDPNCPKGQDCRTTTGDAQLTTGDAQLTTGDAQQPVDDNYLPTDTTEQFKGLTATELRQMILASGSMSQEQLDGIADEQLMAAYQETLKQ